MCAWGGGRGGGVLLAEVRKETGEGEGGARGKVFFPR